VQSGWRWAVEVVGSLLFTSMVNRGTTMTHAFRRHVRLDDPIWIGGILLFPIFFEIQKSMRETAA
jgi:hypothetical protein